MKKIIIGYWNSFILLDADIRIAGALMVPSVIWLIFDLVNVIRGDIYPNRHLPFFFESIVILFAVILLVIHRHEKRNCAGTPTQNNPLPDESD